MQQICKVYAQKTQAHPDFLPSFVQMLGQALEGSNDEMSREVIYHALGRLASDCRKY